MSDNYFNIIDNFLDEGSFNFLKNAMISDTFPWYYNDQKVDFNDGAYQFTHVFYNNYKPNSDYLGILNPIFDKLKIKALRRIKANFIFKDVEIKKFDWHTDFSDSANQFTSIYYLNTNNGKTIFENDKTIKSVSNRMITFNSNLEHAATSHTDEKMRVVINFNYV